MLCDAAHLMPPFAGEGVNMAMLDAIESSNVLLSDDFENAHAEIAQITMESTEALHSPRAVEYLMGVIS
jgi:2-polyprenyl-6-methoxyphenol hydroxylase-like FAD-dependent oxidoreductase